ncbi:translocase of chloroplast 120, chloroplastic [Abrus precatorius]|uniref:Translocase of chloroplast 120, chloroplastic n=1 Tax=Abrus precatorius TaxID=3816 RepID=A0A8B8LGH1_ABRPR|nr:translocase of chloroplast 120, chloroplastic [Abrus precatorius]
MLKDLEVDEVYEEAMEPEEQLHDRGSKLYPGDCVVDKHEDTDTGSALTSALVDENPDAAQEPGDQEDATGVDTESGKLGETDLTATLDLERDGQGIDSVHLNGVDSGGPVDGEFCDESHGTRDDNVKSNDWSDGKEESDLITDGEMLAKENGAMVDGNSELMNDRTEIDDSEFMTPRENGGTNMETGSIDKVDYVADESNAESESECNEVITNQGSVATNLKDSVSDPELKHDKIEVKLNASSEPSSEIQDDTCPEVLDNLAHMNVEHHGEVNSEMKDDDSLGTNISHEDRNGEEMGVCGIQSTESRDYGNEDAQAGSLLENSSTEETQPVQASAADPKEANNKDYQSLIPDEQHRHSDKSSVVEEPEKKQGKNIQEKETTQLTREQNVQPPAGISSSSEKSAGAGSPPVHPAGLGRAAPLLEPASRVVQQPRANGTVSNAQSQQMEDSSSGEAEEYDETREKLQMIRVKFLRLAHRLGQTPHNVVVAQVLYRLGLAEQLRGRNGGRVGAFSFDRASAMAEQLEAAGQEPLDFSCTIMVLGKTGVGKSATINSIFDEVKFNTSAFHMGTKKVQDVVGTVQGIRVRVIDTPGLLPSWSDQRSNEKILHSVKHFIKKTPPDIVLYLDRLDMQSRDFSDMPLLRTITEIFGPSIWFNAIVVLTHAASAPPEGPNGTASSYDMFVTQRSLVVQKAIRQAAGDVRLMNPVSLVENHTACRTNRAGQRVLPNGQVWKPHLLLLSFASKILAEANALLKLQDSPPGKPYIARARAPPLPFLLSTLLQSRPQLKLPEEQFGDEDGLDDDLDESSESDDETELDDLPPFKPLTKAQVEKLSKAQKKAYFDELEYREKLLMKKQLKEEKKRRKMMKKMAETAKDLPSDYSENVEEESGGAASVPVPMPDLALPASFDSDNPTHRYRYLDSSNQWLVRPVLETHGWDHDVGYEGLNVERLFVVRDKIPLSFTGQVTKDKKDANVQMEITSSVKHGEGKATTLGFDMQTVGKDLAYTLRSETRFTNFRRNNATAGLSFTLLGDALSAGMKIEDKLVANKRFKLVISGGAMAGRGDIAYGGSLEAQLRDKDYPLGRFLSTLGISVMDWHGDLAVGCNVQSQIPVGRFTNLVARANLNNRGAGQISIRLNSSEQLQIALIGLIPLLKKLVGYPQQLQFGQ